MNVMALDDFGKHRGGIALRLAGNKVSVSEQEQFLRSNFPDLFDDLFDRARPIPWPSSSPAVTLSNAVRVAWNNGEFKQARELGRLFHDWHGYYWPTANHFVTAGESIGLDPQACLLEHRELVADIEANPNPETLPETHTLLSQPYDRAGWLVMLAIARVNLAVLLVAVGQIDEAIIQFERSLEGVTDPDMQAFRHLSLAVLYAKRGLEQKMTEAVISALNCTNNDVESYIEELKIHLPELPQIVEDVRKRSG